MSMRKLLAIKAVGEDEGRTKFEAIANSGQPDRDGEIIDVAGWEWPDPLPPILWAHDSHSTPKHLLGRIDSIVKEDRGLVVTGSINDKASDVHQAAAMLLRSGDLMGVSVGFDPLAWTDADGSSHTRKRGGEFPWPEVGRRYTRQDLLELSFAPVQSDIGAFVTGLKALGNGKLMVVSPPNEKTVIPYRKFPVDDDSDWDAASEVSEAEVSDLRLMAAFFDSENPDDKSSYKLLHHRSDNHWLVSDGLFAAMADLLKGSDTVPEAERQAVYNHLAKHYDDDPELPEAPEFKSYDDTQLKSIDLYGCVMNDKLWKIRLGLGVTGAHVEKVGTLTKQDEADLRQAHYLIGKVVGQ